MFWGTFDVTTVLFSGEEEPFSGKGRIERSAFDEKMAEFGFWPGDEKIDTPHFFVLPYPFLKSHPADHKLHDPKAFFSEEKMEYLLPLGGVLNAPDPLAAIVDFYTDAFSVIQKQSNWKHAAWFTKPLCL